MKNPIIEVIEKLKPVPIEWDRFTVSEEGYYVAYGWIARSDGQRDFVTISLYDHDDPQHVFYITSSAKYSQEISWLLYGYTDNHIPCRKIDELLNPTTMPEDQVDLDSEIKLTFHIKQGGKSVAKQVTMTRRTLIEYNKRPKEKWADLYEMIVKDKAYIRIEDVSNSN